jgi:multiple sugar transport system substrate-binding protein
VGSYLPGFNALLNDEEVLSSNALLTDPAFQKALSTTIARPVAANYAEVSDTIQVKAHEFLSANGTLDEASTAIKSALEQ